MSASPPPTPPGAAPVDPDALRIVRYPADILRVKARPIAEVTDEVRSVARRMIELLIEAEGIGLAGPQVGLPWRLFVAHVPPNGEDRRLGDEPRTATEHPTVYINPRLGGYSRDLVPCDEGCLSLPTIAGEVKRPSEVDITATDLQGNQFTERARGLLARCWQHETDHLDGVLIIDKFTPIDRRRNKRALEDLERRSGLL